MLPRASLRSEALCTWHELRKLRTYGLFSLIALVCTYIRCTRCDINTLSIAFYLCCQYSMSTRLKKKISYVFFFYLNRLLFSVWSNTDVFYQTLEAFDSKNNDLTKPIEVAKAAWKSNIYILCSLESQNRNECITKTTHFFKYLKVFRARKIARIMTGVCLI